MNIAAFIPSMPSTASLTEKAYAFKEGFIAIATKENALAALSHPAAKIILPAVAVGLAALSLYQFYKGQEPMSLKLRAVSVLAAALMVANGSAAVGISVIAYHVVELAYLRLRNRKEKTPAAILAAAQASAAPTGLPPLLLSRPPKSAPAATAAAAPAKAAAAADDIDLEPAPLAKPVPATSAALGLPIMGHGTGRRRNSPPAKAAKPVSAPILEQPALKWLTPVQLKAPQPAAVFSTTEETINLDKTDID